MILSAHQCAFLPWPGLIDKINQSDAFVILDNVQFERNSFINRNLIAIAGKPHWLTVPVKMKGHISKTIREMEVDESTDWRRKMIETLRHNYSKAQYWEKYHGGIEYHIRAIGGELATVSVWPNEWRKYIKTPMVWQSAIGVTGEKQELIVNLCKHFDADHFLFGRNGRDYVDVDYFRDRGIEPMFQEFTYPIYRQFGDDFIPGLSIVDMLFHCGPDKTREMVCGR